jgi:hypothetical protein
MLCALCSVLGSVLLRESCALHLCLCTVQAKKDNNTPTCKFNLVYQITTKTFHFSGLLSVPVLSLLVVNSLI